MKNRVRIVRDESPIRELRVGDHVDDDALFRGITLKPYHGIIIGGYYRTHADGASDTSTFMGDFAIEPGDVEDLCVALREMKRIVEKNRARDGR